MSLVVKLSLESVLKLVYTLESQLGFFSGTQEESEGTKSATVKCRIWADIFRLREQ